MAGNSVKKFAALKEKWATKKELSARKLKEFFSNRQKRRRFMAIVAILVFVLLLLEAVFQYNRFSGWRVVVEGKQADIDQEIQRRVNLMPNLVKVASKYVTYEQRIFKYLIDSAGFQLAASLQGSTVDMTNPFEVTISRLLYVEPVEWPDLKGTGSIQYLIQEAANTEDRIAEAKLEYNKACEVYNRYRSTFPGDFFGFIFGFGFVPYLGVGQEFAKAPDLQMKVPSTVIRPGTDGGEDVNSSAIDPISWLKARFLESQHSVPDKKLQ